MAEIANRHRPGCAEVVHGGTQIDLRREILDRYSRREFQFLFNCMIATEGFDCPSIGVVAIARPTKSRALYAQMIGRGTRPLPGLVDGCSNASLRQESIRASSKPNVLVLDFVGNSGRHKLINVADVLGGNYDDETVEKASAAAAKKSRAGQSADIAAELEEAERLKEIERKRRQHVVAKASYQSREISPFDRLDIAPPRREPGWHKGRKPTPGQLAALRKFKVAEKEIVKLSFCQASSLLDGLVRRAEQGLCTVRQAELLAKFGYPADITFEAANKLIDKIKQNGWRRPA
jgi:type I site-specific restriction endonuclease